MTEPLGREAARALKAEAHARTICGACQSSTFVLWRLDSVKSGIGSDAILRREERRGITAFESDWVTSDDAPGARAGVVVRCAFFRMNVPDPFAIVVCEGFKPRRKSR